MIIKVPTISRKEIDEKIVTERKMMSLEIDTSFKAHLKWEQYFQEKEGCDLTEYSQKVAKWSEETSTGKKHFLGLLKFLYCYVNSKELPTFSDFCGLFDYEVAEEILDEISKVINEIGSPASKN
jgi:hypothetical protein